MKKQREQAGLNEQNISFTDDAITGIIRYYTREAGVRNLEREIGNVCRKVARRVVKDGQGYSIAVSRRDLNDFLGVMRFRDTAVNEKSEIGLVTGLAWTEVGGSILSTEVTVVEGKGGKPDADRQAGRCHAGIGAGGHHLYPLAVAATRPEPRLLPQYRHSCPCAGGRDPEGRPLGGHHHGDRDCQRPEPNSRAARHRHDRARSRFAARCCRSAG